MIILPSLWQSWAWKNFQDFVGNAAFFMEENAAKALIVERKPHFLKFWKKKFWEIPRGPFGNPEDFSLLLQKILMEAKTQNVDFVRIFPPFGMENFWGNVNIEDFCNTQKITVKAAPEIFPEHTLKIDLLQTEEEILKNMKPKGRYNIRLAEKKNVQVVEEHDVKNFYALVQETAQRDGFFPHKKKVYEKIRESFGKNAILLSAFSEKNELLASAIFVKEAENAVYYYGASTSKNRELMAPYALQWQGMCWAKKNGAQWYDFLGISPENTENHRLKTVSDFKLKFGGERIICDSGKNFMM